LGLVGKGNERDRRSTQEELDRLVAHFNGNARQSTRADKPSRRLVNVRWSGPWLDLFALDEAFRMA
jgi:hypothetical protein